MQFYLHSTATLSPKIVSDKVKKGMKRNTRSKLRLYVMLMQNLKVQVSLDLQGCVLLLGYTDAAMLC